MMTLLMILIPLILAAVSLAISDRKILKIFVLSGAIVEFILALAGESDSLPGYHHPEELALSRRLGIE